MSRVHQRGATTPQMNITPLIDVVFLLIIFFMLVNNIVAEQTVTLIPPTLEEPRTRQLGEVRKIIVSIAPQPYSAAQRADSPLDWDGMPDHVLVGRRWHAYDDFDGITNTLNEQLAAGGEVEVLLRVDSAIYFEHVQGVMQAITNAEHDGNRVQTVNLVAYMPERGQR